MTAFDSLAVHYGADRLGYSNDLYNALLGYGLSPRDHVLDAGCGTGLASRPLIENGFRVTGVDASEAMIARANEYFPAGNWVRCDVQALPFGDNEFDAVISAQAFHYFDARKALEELARVLKPGGIVGIWWRQLMNDDPVKLLRDSVARELSIEPPQGGLTRGFREFYASGLRDTTLRVVPWHAIVSLDEFVDHELSRTEVRDSFGKRASEYTDRLAARLRERLAEGNSSVPLGFIQFLYMARK